MTADRSGCTAEARGGAHARVPQYDLRRAAHLTSVSGEPAMTPGRGVQPMPGNQASAAQPGLPAAPATAGRPGPAGRPQPNDLTERDGQVNIHFSGHWPAN